MDTNKKIHINRFNIAFFYLAFFLFTLSASAETYYVSLSGKDSNTGTSVDKAWATINKINTSHFVPGDTILFEGGSTFQGGIYLGAGQRGELAKIQGTAKAPIVFSSYGKGLATISSGKIAGFKAYNAAGIKIEKLNFIGAGRTVNESFGVEFYMDVPDKLLEYINIKSVDVSGYREAGIAIASWDQTTGGFKDVSITYSSSHDNGDAGIATYAQGTAIVHKNVYVGYNKAFNNLGLSDKWWNHSGSGIMVGGVDGGIIEYCEAFKNGGLNTYNNSGPIGIWGYNSNGLIIQYNESHNNKTGGRTDGGGFDLDGGCTNSIMQYNYSHDNDGAGYVIAQYKDAPPMNNIIVRFNISENDARKNSYGSFLIWGHSSGNGFTNVDIYNNTVYITPSSNGSPSAVYAQLNSSKEVKIRNNIFFTVGRIKLIFSISSPGLRFEGNNYMSSYGETIISWNGKIYNSLEEWRAATGQETLKGNPVGIFIDPELKDPGKGVTIGSPTKLHTLTGYELKESSELIGKGLNLAKEFGIDIGERDYFGNSLEGLEEFSIGAHEQVNIIPLPVTLTSFTATRQGDKALLNWETASEQNSRGFDVEVSLDGSTFRPLGFVASKTSTTSLPQNYSFLDSEPGKSGIRYYRLRQVDLDETATYSSIRALSFEDNVTLGIQVYPNPFTDAVTIEVTAYRKEPLTIKVMDSLGRIILEESQTIQDGKNTVDILLPPQTSAGIYLFTIQYGETQHQIKMLCQ